MPCPCLEPDCSYEQFETREIGMDATEGRFADVTIKTCKTCGNHWLHYALAYEDLSGSGRWYRGLIPENMLTTMTPESAESFLNGLEWHFYGGSYFKTTGKTGSGPLDLGR